MSSTLRAHLALLLAMSIWGSSFIALKIAVGVMHPMQVIFVRMAIGAITFLLLYKLWASGVRYQAGDWKWLLGMAAFEPCLYFIFEAMALQYTTASQAGMITSMLPLMVAAGAWYFLREQISRYQWSGFGIAVIGVVWMSWNSDISASAPNPALGNFLEFLAMASAVGYTLLVKKLTRGYSPLFLTAMQAFVGTAFFFPLAMTQPWPDTVALSTWIILGYLGVVVTLGAYGLYNYALSHISATVTAGYTNLLPVFTLFFGMVLLQDTMNLQQWFAIALVFAGVLLSQRAPKVELPIHPSATPGAS
ncbi:DMT family transporter [Salinispirillum marinum]|uniref:DMT family transporter n=2 Tax=Saccharospirillaceae TaxID=255527 RepID=A0ABV8BA39_9GAMM